MRIVLKLFVGVFISWLLFTCHFINSNGTNLEESSVSLVFRDSHFHCEFLFTVFEDSIRIENPSTSKIMQINNTRYSSLKYYSDNLFIKRTIPIVLERKKNDEIIIDELLTLRVLDSHCNLVQEIILQENGVIYHSVFNQLCLLLDDIIKQQNLYDGCEFML